MQILRAKKKIDRGNNPKPENLKTAIARALYIISIRDKKDLFHPQSGHLPFDKNILTRNKIKIPICFLQEGHRDCPKEPQDSPAILPLAYLKARYKTATSCTC